MRQELYHSSEKILIAGSGIAGCTLAMELHLLGFEITLIDNYKPDSSSRIAAGLISPIVPKGVKLTWRWPELFPGVFNYYHQLETTLNSRFIHRFPTVQIHPNTHTADFWNARANDVEMHPFISVVTHAPLQNIEAPFGYSLVNETGRLDFGKLTRSILQYLQDNGHQVKQEQFDHSLVEFSGQNTLVYQGEKFNHLVFCEGAEVLNNPWFGNLFFNPTAGDILTLKIEHLPEGFIFKNRKWLIPVEKDLYLAGSTFDREFTNTDPKEKDAQEIIETLQQFVKSEMILLEHKKAIRPTVVDRRPYCGVHSEKKNLWIFNGLGAKGTLLCSLFAPGLAAQIKGLQPAETVLSFRRSQ